MDKVEEIVFELAVLSKDRDKLADLIYKYDEEMTLSELYKFINSEQQNYIEQLQKHIK